MRHRSTAHVRLSGSLSPASGERVRVRGVSIIKRPSKTKDWFKNKIVLISRNALASGSVGDAQTGR